MIGSHSGGPGIDCAVGCQPGPPGLARLARPARGRHTVHLLATVARSVTVSVDPGVVETLPEILA